MHRQIDKETEENSGIRHPARQNSKKRTASKIKKRLIEETSIAVQLFQEK
jgi:hypothetical protein